MSSTLKKYNRRLKHSLVRVCFLLLGTFCFAQESLPTDSIFKNARLDIFDNPDNSINSVMNVYKNPNASILQKVESLVIISSAYSSKRDYQKSLEYALLAKEQFSNFSNRSLKIKVLNKIGVQYQQLDIHDKALQYLDEALELINKQNSIGENDYTLGFNYIIRGFIYREQMNCEVALKYFNKSYSEYIKGVNNPVMNANLSTISYNKGNCFLMLNQIDSAQVQFNKAISYAEKIEAKSLTSFAQKGLAEVYSTEGNYIDALSLLKSAHENSKYVGDLILNKGLYNAIATNYKRLKQLDKFHEYRNKYLQTDSLIKQTELKTTQQSINSLFENHQHFKEKSQLETSTTKTIIWSIFALFILLFSYKLFELKKKTRKINKELSSFISTKSKN